MRPGGGVLCSDRVASGLPRSLWQTPAQGICRNSGLETVDDVFVLLTQDVRGRTGQ